MPNGPDQYRETRTIRWNNPQVAPVDGFDVTSVAAYLTHSTVAAAGGPWDPDITVVRRVEIHGYTTGPRGAKYPAMREYCYPQHSGCDPLTALPADVQVMLAGEPKWSL